MIGRFRAVQNWVGGNAFGPRGARFVPPKPDDVPGLVDDLALFCARTDLPPLVLSAVAHAQLEVIHPFVDGNGRVGRMLLQHLLLARTGLATPVPVSVPWSRDMDRYVAGLRAYEEEDLDTWLQLVCWATMEAVGWMRELTERITMLLSEMRNQVRTRGRSIVTRVIDDFPLHPIVDTQSVAARYGVTPQSAHKALIRLEAAGVLHERPFARRRKGRPRRAFAAVELVKLLGEP
jgi:Fic family protein